MVRWVLALGEADQRLDLVHLSGKLLVLPVKELKLALLADHLVLHHLVIEVFADGGQAGSAGRDDLESADLLVAEAHLLIEQENVVFELRIESLELADLLLELVASVVGAAELFSPDL